MILLIEDADERAADVVFGSQAHHPFDVPDHLLVYWSGDELHERVVLGEHAKHSTEFRVVGHSTGHDPLVPVLVEAERGRHAKRARGQRAIQ